MAKINIQESDADPDFAAVYEALKLCEKHGLEVEVFVTAFREIQANPKLTIQQALNVGLYEWDV